MSRHERGNPSDFVRYDVVAGRDGEWIVRRDGHDLARRGSRSAAKTLATHMAWRESSHKHIRTIVHCEDGGACTSPLETDQATTPM